FISYSRQDQATADHLCKALDEAGVSYWIDRRIHGSANFLSEIPRYIKQCRVMIFIASSHSAVSEFTQKEILFALKHHKTIIPYRIGKFRFENNDELDFVFTNVQWKEREEDVVASLDKLGLVPKKEPLPPPAPKTPISSIETPLPISYSQSLWLSKHFSKKWILAAIVGVLLAAILYCWEPWVNRVVVSEATGSYRGHEWVDLGLSVKWAACNVGASSPSEYGDYYAWGEIAPKSEYTEQNSLSYGEPLGNIAGDPQYDVATAKWSGRWRMPTKEELEELKSKCIWTWGYYGDCKGYKVEGPNGNSIFLPAAGQAHLSDCYVVGEAGHYWSSSVYEFDSCKTSYSLPFNDEFRYIDSRLRNYGRSVRPVFDKTDEEFAIETEHRAREKAEADSLRAIFVQDSIVRVTDSLRVVYVRDSIKIARAIFEASEIKRLRLQDGLGNNGIYQVGDYYNKNGKEGVVFYVDETGKHGKIVSMTQSSEIFQWSSNKNEQKQLIGASSETDGVANMRAVQQRPNWRADYPAFAWCADLGDSWYLPAIQELRLFTLNDSVHDTVNRTLEAKGGTKLYNKGDVVRRYLSSTEYDYQDSDGKVYALNVRMYDGYTYRNSKNATYSYVRAVSAF
ncbi:MAG: TIR domain-containing protein, partial [Alistipes sp.]|nr:TIR domain-containing protein [Alistipes sp.]